MSSLRFTLTIAALLGTLLILIWILLLDMFPGRGDQGSTVSVGSGYSSSASARSDFALYTYHHLSPNCACLLDVWRRRTAIDTPPEVLYNHTGKTARYLTIVHPPDMLNLHPGPAGEKSVVRWTAPTSATVKIEGRFQGIDKDGTTTDVAVNKNTAKTLFSANINGYGAKAPFSITTTVAAGDTIDFAVGYGGNADYTSDSTGLSATITPTEAQDHAKISQSVVGDFSATDNPSGAWSYGYLASAGSGYSSSASAGSGYSSSASAGSGLTLSGAIASQNADTGTSGESFSLGSFSDAPSEGPWEVTVNWGDGSSNTSFLTNETGELTAQHTYTNNGTYTVTVKVAEAGGTASDSNTFEVTVTNLDSAADDFLTKKLEGRVPKYEADLVDDPRECPYLYNDSDKCFYVQTQADNARSLALIVQDIIRRQDVEANSDTLVAWFDFSSRERHWGEAYAFRDEALAHKILSEETLRRATVINGVYLVPSNY